MTYEKTDAPAVLPALAVIPRTLLWVLLAATLTISTAYGMLLLLPLYIVEIGGDEADYGLVTAAAAIPTAVALGLLIRYSERVRPHLLLAVTSAVYGLAAVAVAYVDTLGPVLVALGLVLGTAWAAAYTTAPMVISDLVANEVRARAIGYVTGTIQVGFGLGPILGSLLHRRGLSYPAVFLIGAGLAATAVALVVPLAAQVRQVMPQTVTPTGGGASMIAALWRIARSPAIVPLVMVLLSACLFTTMNSFQTTFAENRGLNYDLFYAGYTIAVITVRLGLSRMLADSASDRVVRLSTLGIVAAVVGFLLVGSNPVLYLVVSVLLGSTYGLALPAVQARAVNLTVPSLRPKLLPLAGLLFEVAILAFPLAAGFLIRLGSYRLLFGVLLVFSIATAMLGLRRSERVA